MKTCVMCEVNPVTSRDFGGLCSQECLDAVKAFLTETLMQSSAKELMELGNKVSDPTLKTMLNKVADEEIKLSGGSKL